MLDRGGLISYRRKLVGTQDLSMGSRTRKDVIEVISYQLKLLLGRAFILHDVLYLPLLSISFTSSLFGLGFAFS